MGIACSAEKPDQANDSPYGRAIRVNRISILEELSNDDKIKEKNEFKFDKEYKIGPYITENSEKQEPTQNKDLEKKKQKTIVWQNMYNKQKEKLKQLDDKEENNGFVLTKLEKFLISYKEQRANSFYTKVKQGPPEVLRWSTWKATLQINQYFEKGLYESFIGTEEFDEPTKEQIQKDITRTFPKQFYFNHKEIKGQSIGRSQLQRILFGISNYFPKLGYCQGMNFTLGFLLLISGGKEIDVFWSFISLIKNPKYLIMGIYETDMPLLHLMEFMTEHLLKKCMPKFYDRLTQLEVQNSIWLTKWFMTLFLYSFPISICMRIWDYMIVEGLFGLVSLVIPIIKIFENEFYVINDLEVLQYFQQLTKNEDELEIEGCPHYMNMDKITEEAKQYRLSRKKIAKLTKKFLGLHQDMKSFKESLKIYTSYDKEEKFKKKAKRLVDSLTYFNLKQQQEEEEDYLDPNAIIDIRKNKSVGPLNKSKISTKSDSKPEQKTESPTSNDSTQLTKSQQVSTTYSSNSKSSEKKVAKEKQKNDTTPQQKSDENCNNMIQSNITDMSTRDNTQNTSKLEQMIQLVSISPEENTGNTDKKTSNNESNQKIYEENKNNSTNISNESNQNPAKQQ